MSDDDDSHCYDNNDLVINENDYYDIDDDEDVYDNSNDHR